MGGVRIFEFSAIVGLLFPLLKLIVVEFGRLEIDDPLDGRIGFSLHQIEFIQFRAVICVTDKFGFLVLAVSFLRGLGAEMMELILIILMGFLGGHVVILHGRGVVGIAAILDPRGVDLLEPGLRFTSIFHKINLFPRTIPIQQIHRHQNKYHLSTWGQ